MRTFDQWFLEKLGPQNAAYLKRHPVGKAAIMVMKISSMVLFLDFATDRQPMYEAAMDRQ